MRLEIMTTVHPRLRLVFLLAVALAYGGSPASAQPQTPATNLTLADALRGADQRDEEIAAADEELDVARADLASAASDLMPSVDLSAARTQGSGVMDLDSNTYSENKQYWRSEVEVSTPLLDLDDVGDLVAAKGEQKVAGAEREFTRQQVLYAVTRAYYEALASHAAVEVAQASVDAAEALEDAALVRLAAGYEIKLEVNRAKADRLVAEGERQQAAFQAHVADLGLAHAANLPLEPFTLSTPHRPQIPGNDTPSRLDLASIGRPDLLSAKHSMGAARARRHAAGLELVPDIGLAFNGLYTDVRDDRDPERWRLMLEASWTLPGLIDTPADIARARAQERQAALSVGRLERDLELSVRVAEIQLDAAEAALRVAQERDAVAHANLEAGMRLYGEGLATGLEVATLKTEQDAAAAGMLEKSLARNLAEVALLEVLGVDPLEAYAATP